MPEQTLSVELRLQEHFTDDELTQHRMTIMQKIDFPTMLLWLKFTFPAMREGQSIGMLSGLKANAPQQAFDQVVAVLKEVMEPKRFESLIGRL